MFFNRYSRDRYNYESDPRVSDARERAEFDEGVDQKKKIYTFYVGSDEWNEEEGGVKKTLPLCWGVCDSCDGEGKYVNPSIDAGGISQDDEFWDDDVDEETGESRYFSGHYDVTCESCKGRTTVLVIDRDAADAETLALYDKRQRDAARYERERMAELRAGA